MMKGLNKFFEWFVLIFCTGTVLLFLGVIILDIIIKGWPAISWEFISQTPTKAMTSGGIFPAIFGTILLTLLTALFCIPFGVSCAIYLNEYAEETNLTRIIRASIRNLSGIPSTIYGLFGLALFVQGLNLGTSMVSAGLTLGLLSLPNIITTRKKRSAEFRIPREKLHWELARHSLRALKMSFFLPLYREF